MMRLFVWGLCYLVVCVSAGYLDDYYMGCLLGLVGVVCLAGFCLVWILLSCLLFRLVLF